MNNMMTSEVFYKLTQYDEEHNNGKCHSKFIFGQQKNRRYQAYA